MASSWKNSSTNASQIQKNWNTYTKNKAYASQLKKAEKKQPTYKNAYKGYENAVVNQLENRGFEFDPAINPVYQAYSNDYRLLGNIAADQTAATTESLSGGYGTTYSGEVASQGLQGYLQNEKNIIPALYQQERANYQSDTANLINKGNLYNSLEAQDFAQFQDKLARWNENREYAYNKFYNDYMASAKQHQTTSGRETARETEGSTRTISSGGRRRTKTNPIGSRKFYKNLMSKEQFENEVVKNRIGAYAGIGGESEKAARKRLDSDYQDYLQTYINQALGKEKENWFEKKLKKVKR